MQKTISIFISAVFVLIGASCANSSPTDSSAPMYSANTSMVTSDAADVESDTQEKRATTNTPTSSTAQNSEPVESMNTTSANPSTQGESVSVEAPSPSSSPTQNSSPSPVTDMPTMEQDVQAEDEALPALKIQIKNTSFTATLYDNASTRALLKKLPLTLNMDELNGNEKYYFFSDSLPTASEKVSSIKTGDLMLYGSDCLVLFYEDFSTSYSYTRIGYVEDVRELSATLGNGSVQVTFSNR